MPVPSRRAIAVAATLAVLSGALVACSSGAPGQSNEKTLTVAVSDSPSASALKAVAKYFTASTGVKVSFVDLPYDQITAKTLLAAKSKTANFDVVQVDSPMLAALKAGGALKELDSLISGSKDYDQSDLPQQVQDYAKVDGKSYAIPLSSEPYVLWYRKDLFEKAGITSPPTTYDEYKAASDKMKALGAYGSDSGFGSQIGAYYWLETVYNYGGALYDPSTCKSTLSNSAGTNATKMYLSLKDATPATAVNGGGNEMTTAFVQQEVAQMINATGYYSIVSDPKQSKVTDSFAMAVPPGGDGAHQTLLFGWLIGIMANSSHQSNAWKFLDYALNKDGVVKMIDNGAPPPARTSLLSNSAVTGKLPYLPTLVEAAKIGQHLPYTTAMPKIITSLSQILNNMAVSGLSVADGLSQADAAVNEALAQPGACSTK